MLPLRLLIPLLVHMPLCSTSSSSKARSASSQGLSSSNNSSRASSSRQRRARTKAKAKERRIPRKGAQPLDQMDPSRVHARASQSAQPTMMQAARLVLCVEDSTSAPWACTCAMRQSAHPEPPMGVRDTPQPTSEARLLLQGGYLHRQPLQLQHPTPVVIRNLLPQLLLAFQRQQESPC